MYVAYGNIENIWRARNNHGGIISMAKIWRNKKRREAISGVKYVMAKISK